MIQQVIKGLERQDAFVKSMKGQDFDFGLVMTQAFLKGIRDIGYKSTATALFESFDNSIQADASNIHLLFDFDKNKTVRANPDRIAIVDDGHGMSKEMIRIAVLWGGSDRLDDRKGMGKYGYGLPSSCVSIGERFTVISKREDMKDWYAVTIDINKIAEHDPEYIDPKTGRIVAPEAKVVPVPDFIKRYEYTDGQKQKHKLSLTHGTIILIEKIDRLSKSTFKSLKSFLSLETGITYRNFLRSTNVFIHGDIVEPVDPLFITEGYRFYDENDLRAEALPTLEISVPSSLNKEVKGLIKVRYSYMPHGFLNKKPDDNLKSDQLKLIEDDDHDEDEESKKNKSKRLTVRKRNTGIMFLRNGRQIDVVDSRCPWTKFQTNDRYVGVEVDFTPELDEDFSITTSKQQIVVSERLWNILLDKGVYEAISQMRRKYEKQAEEEKRRKANQINSSPENRDDFAENLMKEAARDFEIDKDSQPQHVKKEGEENLDKKAKKIADSTGLPEDVVKQQLETQTQEKPYKLEYFDELEGPFYRAEQVGGQTVIYVNQAHRFYTDLFNNPNTGAFMKNALALLVFVLGHSELRVTDEKRRWYKIERNAWSLKLDTILETLSKHFAKSVDDAAFEHEMNVNEINSNTKK